MKAKNDGGDPPEGYEYIYVQSYFHKGLGRRVYAYEYGKKCFRLMVKVGGKPTGGKRAA